MARRCSVTAKGVQSGNNVSHAKNRTRRRFLPNLQVASFMSEALGRPVTLRISTQGMRTIEHNGGIDPFLLKASKTKLSLEALRLKRAISKAAVGKSA
jgi:large subunit ribosomal protein L28